MSEDQLPGLFKLRERIVLSITHVCMVWGWPALAQVGPKYQPVLHWDVTVCGNQDLMWQGIHLVWQYSCIHAWQYSSHVTIFMYDRVFISCDSIHVFMHDRVFISCDRIHLVWQYLCIHVWQSIYLMWQYSSCVTVFVYACMTEYLSQVTVVKY